MPRTALAAAATALTLLAGCGGDPPAPSQPAIAPSTSAATTTAASPTTAAQAMDAKAVLDALKAAGLPLTAIVAQDENTDPNDKLGRPGQYTSRASADVPGGDKTAEKYSIDRGIVAEVFATPEDAAARAKYIQDALRNAPILGTEYHYQPADKRILVRLTGEVKPSAAKAYEAAVAAL